MRSLFYIAVFAVAALPCSAQSDTYPELELSAMLVLTHYTQNFDLSGIVNIKDKLYVISDQRNSGYLYTIEPGKDHFQITDSTSLGIDEKSDLEAVDYCENFSLFFTDERDNKAYISSMTTGEYREVFDSGQLPTKLDWGTNKGLEGIAVDCQNKILYLAKEREPRFIITYDLEKKHVTNITMNDPLGDISDLKYENGFLYILERNENTVAKMDVRFMDVVSKVSYKSTCSHPEGKLYKDSEYGMGEALLLTPDEIWIGLDNNGLTFSDYATKTYGLQGNSPVIIRFKRPEGF